MIELFFTVMSDLLQQDFVLVWFVGLTGVSIAQLTKYFFGGGSE